MWKWINLKSHVILRYLLHDGVKTATVTRTKNAELGWASSFKINAWHLVGATRFHSYVSLKGQPEEIRDFVLPRSSRSVKFSNFVYSEPAFLPLLSESEASSMEWEKQRERRNQQEQTFLSFEFCEAWWLILYSFENLFFKSAKEDFIPPLHLVLDLLLCL